MPHCVVKWCKNHSSRSKKQDGITFHTFPKRLENINKKWIAVIRNIRNEPLWLPTSNSVVCSVHFKDADLYFTNKGFRRVKQNGYPKIFPGIRERLDNADQSQTKNVVQITIPEPDISYSDFKHTSTSCTVEPVSPNFDTLMKQRLRNRVLFLEKRLKNSSKKVRTLTQKVRRLNSRNKLLQEILNNIK